jgi:glycosyltransferase involved in cell wall biosynthesis
MRIGLASIHPRALSGQIEYLVGLARQLRALGHTVEVVSAFPAQELLADDRLALSDGDRGWLLPKLTRIGRILRVLEAAAQRVDLIHFNLPTPAFAILADVLQLRVPVPVIAGFEAHLPTLWDICKPSRLLADPAFYLPRLVVNNGLVARMTLRRAACYLVSSDFQQKELLRLGIPAERIAVIPNVLNTAKLVAPPKPLARALLGLPDNPLVVYIGHYNPVKGVDVLARAFGELASRQPAARLVLAWSGLGNPKPVERALAASGVGDRVIRLGKVDVATALAAADVVALPYRQTTGQAAFPGLVLETMQVGVPLVISDLPLLREIVTDGQTALLVPPENAQALADQLDRLLRDRALAAQMVAQQRRQMATVFDPHRLAAAYVRLYEAVLDTVALTRPAAEAPRVEELV